LKFQWDSVTVYLAILSVSGLNIEGRMRKKFEYFCTMARRGKLKNSEKAISLWVTRTIWHHSFAEYALCEFEEFRKFCAFI